MKAIPASELRNAWHTYLERVRLGRESVVITRYGKPIAKLCPIQEPEQEGEIFGCLSGTVTVHGDIIAPLSERWEADA
jgi:prevent-host-death family protein